MKTRQFIPIAKPIILDDDKRRVLEVLESGMLVAGKQVKEFERACAEYVGIPEAIATSSGTTALQIAIEALGIRPGDRVITTPFTFVATGNAILHARAIPVFVDVDPTTYNLDPHAVEESLRREGARALLCVHLYGQPSDLDALGRLAKTHGLLLIEDCAQAHGARLHGRHVGTFGQAGVFSFYPTKNMTTGEGGLIVTADSAAARRARVLINVGQDEANEYVYEVVGYNYRMTNIAGALGLAQLARLDRNNEIRRAHAAQFTAAFSSLGWLHPPIELPGTYHVYHQYTVRIPRGRDRFIRHLGAHGIAHRIYYPQLVPHSPAYRRLGFGESYPVAEMLTQQVLSLPVHPALTNEDIDQIIDVVRAFDPDRV